MAIFNSQGLMTRVFSLKSTPLNMWVMYSVGEDIVEQICENSKTKCFVGIS